jgi:tRNA G46 methylase TrmB
MLTHRILGALVRCSEHISVCATRCFQELASTLKGYYLDKKLGDIDTSYSFSDSFTQGNFGDSLEYVPSGYSTIETMLRHLRLREDDVFVDFGCGKGRVIFAAATHPLRKVIGIEVDKTIVDVARANLAKITSLNPNIALVEILHLDATVFDPKMGTIFFMFNPFEYKTMQQVLK